MNELIENSKILLSEKDSKMIFYALRRLFFCCIRASDEETKMRKAKGPEISEEMDYEFEEISTESEKKIHSEALSQIHNQLGENLNNPNLKRKPLEKNFKYDNILIKEGKSEELEEELVKVYSFLTKISSSQQST